MSSDDYCDYVGGLRSKRIMRAMRVVLTFMILSVKSETVVIDMWDW